MTSALVDYLTMACAGTGQATFYNTRDEQAKALEGVHGELLRENRRIYALSAALPITDRSRQMVLENLLNTGSMCEDGALEGHVVSMVASDMQFNRLLNLFVSLRQKKVNNRRTRKFGELIWSQVDAFRAIKYRDKLRTLLRHCHISEGSDPVQAELHRWIFGPSAKHGRSKMRPEDVKHNPKLKARLEAATDYSKLFELPYDIARDIAVASHGKKVEDFQREFAGHGNTEAKGKVTRKESMRVRKQTKDTSVDFNRFSIFELLMHGYRTPTDQEAILEILHMKAKDVAEGLNLPEQVALVVDNSVSALGSGERQFQPVAMLSAVVHICQQAESDVKTFYVGPEPTNGWIMAEGATNMRRPLVDALLTRPDLVILLSDGYENVRSGSVEQILATKAVRDSGISVMHVNPVAAVEAGDKTRTLSKHAMTFGLSSPEQLPMVALVGLAAQDVALLEPMFHEVETNLLNGDYRAAKLATRVAGLPALV